MVGLQRVRQGGLGEEIGTLPAVHCGVEAVANNSSETQESKEEWTRRMNSAVLPSVGGVAAALQWMVQ